MINRGIKVQRKRLHKVCSIEGVLQQVKQQQLKESKGKDKEAAEKATEQNLETAEQVAESKAGRTNRTTT